MSVVETPLNVYIGVVDSAKRQNISLRPVGALGEARGVEIGLSSEIRVASLLPDPARSRLQRGLIAGIGARENLTYLTSRKNFKNSSVLNPEKRKQWEQEAVERRRKPSRCVISKPHEKGQCPTGQPWRCKSSENYRLDKIRKSARDRLDGTTLAKSQSGQTKNNFAKAENIKVLPSAKAAVQKAAQLKFSNLPYKNFDIL